MRTTPWLTIFSGILLALLMATCGWAKSPGETAAAADRILREEVQGTGTPAPKIDDQVFLRRVHLDIVGEIPRPGEITAFVLDPDPKKREKLVDKLLADPRFGRNWGRYWRDVIMYRKTENRSQIVAGVLLGYLQKELNSGSPWSKLATDMITATGDATEHGECALIVAQQGQPEETVAEISRIFLGVQISCAQCHDHPWDRWKREQFHELAAFFPRVSSRLILAPARLPSRGQAIDNSIGQGLKINNNRVRGTLEHHMPDLKDPDAKGKLMQPVLFATGDKLSTGTKDADRRDKLAEFITKKDNPFFGKAFVNRVWGELCGEGFYEPLDDIGPDRECSAPKTLDYLAAEVAEQNYDVKWLYRTLIATEQFQRQSQPRRNPDQPPFQANVAQRLRSDVVLDNLMGVLGFKLPDEVTTGVQGRLAQQNVRNVFGLTFGYDPSQRRDEISGSILQALAMMNSPNVNTAINGRFGTELSRILTTIKSDDGVIEELYLRTLGREPTQAEKGTCKTYLKEVNNRAEAFEDIQWSLINSTEFLYRQ